MKRRDAATRTLTFFDPLPVRAKLLREHKLDGILWTRETLSDGTLAYRGTCPCGTLLQTGFQRLMPSAAKCPACGKWRRLP